VSLSFLRGFVAAVNPCGFVLLPTYLMFFLGSDVSAAVGDLGSRRAGVRRALVVSAALTAGFMTVFVVVGLVTYHFTSWIQRNAKYATIVIAVGLVALGISMLRGYRLPIAAPRLDRGGRSRGVGSMFVYGIAYAVASLGCTIGLFLPSLFSARDDGLVAATAQVAAYGAGMGLLVTALTVSLAVARTGLLGVLRASMQRVEQVAAGFVILSGLYLAYYFWVVDIGGGSDPIVEAVDRIQRSVIDALQQRWQLTAVVLGALVLAAGVYSRRPARGRD
jgi:cytochrome c-type biogenesis protein